MTVTTMTRDSSTVGSTASVRLHAVTVLSRTLVAELKVVASTLNAFTDAPKSNAVSPALERMFRAASFCGFWGVANYLGALRELAVGIESVPPASVDRTEYLERVKTLASGFNGLGLYLRDLASGTVVSYSELNEHFGRVIRKARPQLLELSPAVAAPILFMPAPPSLEVDAKWVADPSAARVTLASVLASITLADPNYDALVAANPYASLAGLFEVAATLREALTDSSLRHDLHKDFERLAGALQAEPTAPPTPDAFVFSRLLFSLASSDINTPKALALRKRYALRRPGKAGDSLHDLARKYADGMKRLQDAYLQAALARTPSALVKLTQSVAADSHRLESPAFTTVAAALADLTAQWGKSAPDLEGWTYGAGLVLLMREAAEKWGHHESQENLSGVVDVITGTGQLQTCESMQESIRSTALQKAFAFLLDESGALNRSIEGALRSVREDDLSEAQAARVSEVVGGQVQSLMQSIAGVVRCIELPHAADFALQVGQQAQTTSAWATRLERARLFESISVLNLFLSRLRPGSLLDMEVETQPEPPMLTDELAGQSDAADAVPEVQRAREVETVIDPAGEPVHDPVVDVAHVDMVDQAEAAMPPVQAEPELALEPVSVLQVDQPANDSEGPEVPAFDVASSSPVTCALGETVEEHDDDALDAPQDSVVAEGDDLFAFLGSASLPSAEELEAEFDAAMDGRSNNLDRSDSELLSIMFEESWQCLDSIDAAFAATRAGDCGVAEARRHIHTLKGVSRTCGLQGIGALLHAMEDRLEAMPEADDTFLQLLKPFEIAMVRVRALLEEVRSSVMDDVSTRHEAGPTALPAADTGEPTADVAVSAQAVPVEVATPSKPATGPARAATPTVRIPVQVADKVGESSVRMLTASRRALEEQQRIARAFRELDDNLKRMAPAIRELDVMAAASIASSSSQVANNGFDALELDRYTQMQEVTRRLVEAFEDAVGSAGALADGLRLANAAEQDRAELSDELQRGSSELRLVAVASQHVRLERVVAKACADAGREADLVIEAGCRIPAAALDKLMPVLEHILRNAVAHGIEPESDRIKAGKSAAGVIVIGTPAATLQEGGVVRISVRDDGAGIDLDRVKAAAVRRGLVPAGRSLSAEATRELLFMPGFSTAGTVSELAGRGVGLDVVRSTLSSLGGVVAVESERGRGTEFVLTMPTDAASMAVIPVSAGGFKCLLPLTLVRRIVPVSAGSEVVMDAARGIVSVAGVEHQLVDLARRVPASKGHSRAGRGHLVMMQETNIVKAVLVDTVGQQTRVVVKPLGPFVRDIPGMVAGSTMGAGGIGLVVNPLQLADIAAESRPERGSGDQKRVMVVDDSSTVRLVTARFLKRIGYAVDVARDGLEALQLLGKGVRPDVFLFDLEMPGMGGFELIQEVRRREQFAATPIVVVTSRTADKHRDRAVQLGASAYLAKPYEDAQLSEVLDRFAPISL